MGDGGGEEGCDLGILGRGNVFSMGFMNFALSGIVCVFV